MKTSLSIRIPILVALGLLLGSQLTHAGNGPARNTITTGIWVGGVDPTGWYKIGLDGATLQDLKGIYYYDYNQRMAFNPADKTTWIATFYAGRAIQIDEHGNILRNINTGRGYQTDIKVDSRDGSFWIITGYGSIESWLMKFDSAGIKRFEKLLSSGPGGMGGLWLAGDCIWANTPDGQVLKFDLNGSPLAQRDLSTPADTSWWDIVGYAADGSVSLVSATGSLYKLGPTGATLWSEQLPLESDGAIFGMDIDPVTGDLWMIAAYTAQLFKVDQSGNILLNTRYDSLLDPPLRPTLGNIAVDPSDGGAIFTLAEARRVAKVDSAGGVVFVKSTPFSYTAGPIAVEYDRLPVADAGPDQPSVVAVSPSGALVTLDGTGSSDPDGGPLTYAWTGPFGTASGSIVKLEMPLGVHAAVLTVTDPHGMTATDEVLITVVDTQPPTITAPANVTTPSDSGKCYATGVVLGTPTTADNCGVATVINNAPTQLPVGNTVVTWTVTDVHGLTAQASQLVTVQDTEHPALNVGCPSAPLILNSVVPTAVSYSDNCGINLSASTLSTTFDTGSVGPKTVTFTAVDVNGNATSMSCTYQVQYVSSGTCGGVATHAILQPINSDGASMFKQGSTVPVKFRVCDALGNSIGTPGLLASFKLIKTVSGTLVASVDEAVDLTTPDSAFRFDPSGQHWIFNMSTKSLAVKTTHFYEIKLNDGTSILFQFGLR